MPSIRDCNIACLINLFFRNIPKYQYLIINFYYLKLKNIINIIFILLPLSFIALFLRHFSIFYLWNISIIKWLLGTFKFIFILLIIALISRIQIWIITQRLLLLYLFRVFIYIILVKLLIRFWKLLLNIRRHLLWHW